MGTQNFASKNPILPIVCNNGSISLKTLKVHELTKYQTVLMIRWPVSQARPVIRKPTSPSANQMPFMQVQTRSTAKLTLENNLPPHY